MKKVYSISNENLHSKRYYLTSFQNIEFLIFFLTISTSLLTFLSGKVPSEIMLGSFPLIVFFIFTRYLFISRFIISFSIIFYALTLIPIFILFGFYWFNLFNLSFPSSTSNIYSFMIPAVFTFSGLLLSDLVPKSYSNTNIFKFNRLLNRFFIIIFIFSLYLLFAKTFTGDLTYFFYDTLGQATLSYQVITDNFL